MVPRGVLDVEEDAPNLPVVGAAAAVEEYAALAAFEQCGAEVLLEHADAVGDGGGGDADFLGGAGETLVAPRGLEVAQAIEWRQGVQVIGDQRLKGSFRIRNI